DYVDEVKNPRAVRPADGHVGIRFRVRQVELDVPADRVIHDNFLAREPETHRAFILIDAIRGAEPIEITPINLLALTLEIRAKIPARFRAFIPIELEPAQPVINRARRLLGVPGAVRVFDPQN